MGIVFWLRNKWDIFQNEIAIFHLEGHFHTNSLKEGKLVYANESAKVVYKENPSWTEILERH